MKNCTSYNLSGNKPLKDISPNQQMNRKNANKTQDYPKISIVIPSLNQGQFIEQTITSILSQKYPNTELIIIDGGSTDETMKVVKKYRNKIAYFISEKDSGQSEAINKGMKKATGEILAYLNSDDYYLPGTFKKVADFFNQHADDVDLLYSDVYLVDVNGKFLNYAPALNFRPDEYVYRVFSIPQQGAFWTRKAYNQVGGFREDNHADMDGEFFLHLSLAGGKFCFIREPLACFRIHSTSKTGTYRHKKEFIENYIKERTEVFGKNPSMLHVTLKILYLRLRNIPHKTYRRMLAPKLPRNYNS